MLEVDVPDFKADTLQYGKLRELAGSLTLVGLKNISGDMLITPDEDVEVVHGEKLFVIGENQALTDFKKRLKEL